MTRERVTGWHFDSQDTPHQRSTLRRSQAAQRTRARFGPGTRVCYDPVAYPKATAVGTVQRHIPGTNAQGGVLRVLWDNGAQGYLAPINAARVD